jgi:hypothetical protein
VERDVASAPGFEHLDAARREDVASRQDMRAATIAADAKRQDVRMFEQEQHIVDAFRATLLDQPSLQVERL